jgi:hypothetical protein
MNDCLIGDLMEEYGGRSDACIGSRTGLTAFIQNCHERDSVMLVLSHPVIANTRDVPQTNLCVQVQWLQKLNKKLSPIRTAERPRDRRWRRGGRG